MSGRGDRVSITGDEGRSRDACMHIANALITGYTFLTAAEGGRVVETTGMLVNAGVLL